MRSETARVFFALWPDHPVQQALAKWAQELHAVCGGKQTRPDTIHLTLVFLGDVPIDRLDALREIAATIRIPAFDWTLDQADCWRRNRIAWAGASTVPPELAELVNELETRLQEQGVAFDQRPYAPHVTLLRHAICVSELPVLPPVNWRASEFVLIQSVRKAGGSEYQIIGRWPLQPE